MKNDIFEKIEKLALNFEREDIEKSIEAITTRFSIDLSKINSTGETVSPLTRRSSTSSRLPKKMDIGFKIKDEDADYRLLHILEEGITSNVYLAKQIPLKRTVAIKMMKNNIGLKPEDIDQFMGEAQITGKLSHPNIIPVHDAGIDPNGCPFYAMKSMQGILWDKFFHQDQIDSDEEIKKYGVDEHLEILDSVCNAIAFAHSKNVIHRDLKPSNVVIGDFGEVIVMNWGLTVSVGDHLKESGVTETNAFGGTFRYMAPEMASADAKNIGKKSDIYLLGAILYEILTGHSPHEAESPKKSLADAMCNRIKLPNKKESINRDLMSIALKAMETETSSRYTSVIDLQKELRSYMAHEESRTLTEDAKQLLESAQKQNKLIKILRAGVLLEEALHMWNKNVEAKDLLIQAEEIRSNYSNEFNSCLIKLIIREDIYKILLRLITIPIYLMLFLLPFFFYLYVLWSTPLYEIGNIKVRQFDKLAKKSKVITSELLISNAYLLFDNRDLYHIENRNGKIIINSLFTSNPIELEENEYYLDDRKWIVAQEPDQILITEKSPETAASKSPHYRVLNPLMLMKVKKHLNEFKVECPTP